MQISGKEDADLQNSEKIQVKSAINRRPPQELKRIGIAKEKFIVPDNLDAGSNEIAESLINGDL